MTVDWTSVEKQVGKSVGKIVGPAWHNAASGAKIQFAAIIAAGQRVEQNKDDMRQEEYDSLKLMQKRALDGVLQTYAGISLDIAQQAADAAWTVVAGALKTAYPVLALAL